MTVRFSWPRLQALAMFGALVYAFAVWDVARFPSLMRAHGVSANVWDVILGSLSGTYIISFLAMPLYLLGIHQVVADGGGPHVVIRYGSRTAAAFSYGIESINLIFPFIGVWIGAAALAASGLPWSWNWSSAANSGPDAFASTYLVEAGAPVMLLITQLAILLIGAGVLAVAMASSYLWSQSTRLMLVVAGVIFALTVISFRVPGIPAPLMAINYLSIHHAVGTVGSVFPYMAGALTFGLIVLGLAHLADRLGRPAHA